jgi:AraC-like DNA-binding protein
MVVLGLYPERRLKIIDTLHLAPFILHAAELIPFYALPEAEKTVFIKNLYAPGVNPWFFKDGLLLAYRDHILIKFAFISCYLTFLWVYIYRYKKLVSKIFDRKNSHVFSFLTFEVLNKSFLTIVTLYITLFYINDLSILLQAPSILLMADILVGITIVLLFPSLLLGVKPVPSTFKIAEPSIQDEALVIEPIEPHPSASPATAKQSYHFELIETMMQRNQPFLEPQFSREKLSLLIGISQHNVTEAITRNTSLSFNDYINTYRINYLCDLVRSEKLLLSYTIEALALKVGFSNRVTFTNAVKRIRGILPKELLDELKKM